MKWWEPGTKWNFSPGRQQNMDVVSVLSLGSRRKLIPVGPCYQRYTIQANIQSHSYWYLISDWSTLHEIHFQFANCLSGHLLQCVQCPLGLDNCNLSCCNFLVADSNFLKPQVRDNYKYIFLEIEF